MGFKTKGSNAMTVKIDHSSRDASGYSSLQVYLRHLEFSLDDSEVREEIEREWDRHRDPDHDTGQIPFVENYLHERYGFLITATPYNGEDYTRKPTDAQRVSLRRYPFYRFTVRPGQGGLFPWTWERTEVFPFNRIIVHPSSFDEFGFDSTWEFSGGATRPMAEDVLDSAPALRFDHPHFGETLVPMRDGIITTVDVVNLAVGSDEVVATLEDHWGRNLFGTDENPNPRPIRDELTR